jgi:hypothetical protein
MTYYPNRIPKCISNGRPDRRDRLTFYPDGRLANIRIQESQRFGDKEASIYLTQDEAADLAAWLTAWVEDVPS